MKSLIVLQVIIWLLASASMAQNDDSNKIVISDVGTGIKMKLGDSEVTFTNLELYNHFIEMGIELAAKENYTEAISYFSTSLLYIWDDPEAFYYRGLAYSYLENYEKALEDFNYALKLNPEHYLSLNGRGIILSKNGDTKSGKSDFEKALEINPEYATTYLNLGITYLIELDYGKACDFLKKASSLGNERAEEIELNYCQ